MMTLPKQSPMKRVLFKIKNHHFLTIYFFIILNVFLSTTSFGQNSTRGENEKPSPQNLIKLTWFAPKGSPQEKNKDLVHVSFSGKASAHTRLFLDVLKEAKENLYESKGSSKPAMTNNSLLATTNEKKEFYFEMDIKPGRYLLRVKAADPSDLQLLAMKTYEMFLTVSADYKVDFQFYNYQETSEDKSKPQENSKIQEKPEVDMGKSFTKNSLSIGTGLNYSSFSKRGENQKNLYISVFKIPFFHFEFERTLSETLVWRFSSMLASGDVTKTSKISFANRSYLWNISSGDLLYSKESWIQNCFDLPIKGGLRGSLQSYSVPFIKNKSSAGNIKDIVSLPFSSYSLGFDLKANNGNKQLYEMMMRFSLPLSLASEMNTSEFLSFDGSLGITFLTDKSPYSWGVFWYGHWVQFNYKENNEDPLLVNQGQNKVIYSNLELRWIWKY